MTVKIYLHPYFLAEQLNDKALEVRRNTVGQCLDDLVKQIPDIKQKLFDKNGELQWAVAVFVNGGSYAPEYLAKQVKDGDQIEVIPRIVSGG